MTAAIGEFFRMGGYGIYVWPAFAFAALVLAAMGWRVTARLRASESALGRMQDRTGRGRS
ncbi:MAG: heme exporter protein CcmD [Alphaproteobacteria bacterium]